MGLTGAKPLPTPLPKGHKFKANYGVLFDDPDKYRRLIRRLLYKNLSRPNISYVVEQLSQFVHQPCKTHRDVAIHVMQHLKSCHAKGLFYPVNTDSKIQAFCDSD